MSDINSNMKMTKTKFDKKSIKTTTLAYFLLLALSLILLIFFLQNLFIKNYYEDMKIKETKNLAKTIEVLYEKNPQKAISYASGKSLYTGTFIRFDANGTTTVFDSGTPLYNSNYPFEYEVQSARAKLSVDALPSVSLLTDDKNSGMSRLVFATYLRKNNDENTGILYIIAPLYPVQSTISILQSQLVYISIIALILSIFIAFFLSDRLLRPIESITKSAIRLSQGKYDIKFNGGNFSETIALAGALNTASYEMQKTDFYHRDLIANVSHDLKTPLTMIKSYAEMIYDISGDNQAKRNEHLQIIISEADRLNNLVSDMLTVSKLQSNNVSLNKEKFDIVYIAKNVFDTFKILNEHDGYNITFEAPKSILVFGDKEKIKQVMANLISNAVKYAGEDKVVNIELKRIGRKIQFSVKDHGVGISNEEISHVWERYYRTSANHGRDIDGTGIGLSIVKGILVLHNADYGVKSKVGKGSTFWFTMDIAKK